MDFSHKAREPTASEAHPVQFHVATDLAQEGMAADDSAHWDVKSEVFNYVERMEWKHELGAMPARRCIHTTLHNVQPLYLLTAAAETLKLLFLSDQGQKGL